MLILSTTGLTMAPQYDCGIDNGANGKVVRLPYGDKYVKVGGGFTIVRRPRYKESKSSDHSGRPICFAS